MSQRAGTTTPDPAEVEMRDLMTPEQLAAQWQVSPKTLANLRSRREGPPYIRVLGLIRYSRREIGVWLAAQQRSDVA